MAEYGDPKQTLAGLRYGDAGRRGADNRSVEMPMQKLLRLLIVAITLGTAGSAYEAMAADDVADAWRSTYRTPESPDVLITNAFVLDGAGGSHNDIDILLRDGVIAEFGRNLSPDGPVTTIDASDRWVTPGLIDIHSHNGTYTLPLTNQGLADIAELSGPNVADTWVEHAINVQDLAFRRALEGGVTTLQIMPGSSSVFGGRTAVLKPVRATTVMAMKFPGAPQGIKMACGENPKGEFGERGIAPTSRQGEVALMRDAWIKARAYLESQQTDDESGVTRDLKLETLAGVLSGDIRVHMHCYRADDIAVMLSVAREFGFSIAAFHHAAEAYKIADLLARSNVCAAVWSDWGGFKMELHDAIPENAAYVDAAGACVAMHSDSPFIGQRLNLEVAKAMAAGRRAGVDVSRESAITWITSNPATALGLDDRIGRIAEGYNADLVVWSGDPFSIYSKTDQVFIDGVLRYDRENCDTDRLTDSELGLEKTGGCQ